VKSKETIRRRLRSLRIRHAKKYIEKSQKRKPENCTYNYSHEYHAPTPEVPTEYELAPRKSSSLVVFQEEGPIKLCLYGADKPSEWKGDVCDKDETAEGCEYFKPKVTVEEAQEDFKNLVADDEYVFKNYRDIATLQWVLGERVSNMPFTLIDRVVLFWHSVFRTADKLKETPELPEAPDDLWPEDDNS
jgi:hypothetical protein